MAETSIDKLISLLQVNNVSTKELMETMNEIEFCSFSKASTASVIKDSNNEGTVTSVANQEYGNKGSSRKTSKIFAHPYEENGNALAEGISNASIQGIYE